MIACTILALSVQASALSFQATSGGGLDIRLGGILVVAGSGFQYYEDGWTKGYYSSRYNSQTIETVGDETVVRFKGADGKVSGSQRIKKVGNRLTIKYRFEWTGDKPAKVEVTAAQLWAPAVLGTVAADGKPGRSSVKAIPGENQSLDWRQFASPARNWEFQGPLGPVKVRSIVPLTAFDARNYNQDYASDRSILWVGAGGLDVARGRPAEFEVEMEFPEAKTAGLGQPQTLAPAASQGTLRVRPDGERPPLIPYPREAALRYDRPLPLTGKWKYPAGRIRFQSDFAQTLAQRFIVPKPDPNGKALDFDAGVSKLGLTPGGYRIEITAKGVSVLGEEEEGQRNGMRRLAQLAFVKDGQICLPTGFLKDWPMTRWRGVHLFVGPKAEGFQRQLWRKVLLPLHFNKVVLQCERTAWDATKGTETALTMPKESLAKLFDWYRAEAVEPIPLIQSFGHMEWLFANGKNRDLAFNPDFLYSIDPRKPEAQAMIGKIWDEAITLLNPQTIHFGLDEIDMLGWPDDEILVTQLWGKQLPFLGQIAAKHGVEPMLWGDEALAPGEAPDAANAGTKEHAQTRRLAIPKGAWIADWHYKSDPKPETYHAVLNLWKQNGFRPIASGWYDANNVRGFATAAAQLGAGYLQTTWSGYESSHAALEANFDQYAAMVLAADYAWSGRKENPDKLGHDYREVFRKMFFGGPVSVEGVLVERFQATATLGSVLAAGTESAASEVDFPISAQGQTLELELSAQIEAGENEVVGQLTAAYEGGTQEVVPLKYGVHLRAKGDSRPTRLGAIVRLDPAKKLARISLKQANSFSGLELSGLRVTR